jgi:predicted nucleic acid-binding protein
MRRIMNSKYVLDSYAWVEYSIGSSMGEFVKEILELASCYTPSIVISELSYKFTRENKREEWMKFLRFIKLRTEIILLDVVLSDESGEQKFILRQKEKKMGLADAIIYQTANSLNAQLVSGNIHFEKISNVIYLKNPQILIKELNLLKKSQKKK